MKSNEEIVQKLKEKYFSPHSREYKIFKSQKRKESWYEKLCKFSRKFNFNFSISEEDRKKLDSYIKIADLDIKPEDVFVVSIMSMFFFVFLGLVFFAIFGLPGLGISFLGFVSYLFLKNYPARLVEIKKAKEGSELILAVLYMVIFMRSTSNLEAAVKFVAENLETSLADDFKKMLWDVSSKKYASMKEALDVYVEKWKNYSPVFVDAIHLIEASLYQSSEDSRIKMLNKALEITLEGTYENMTKYANALRMPINLLYMMGIMLPVLGLVMFPIMGTFLTDIINPISLIFLYDVALPALVYIFADYVLEKRPAGFPVPDVENHPDVPPRGKFYFKGSYYSAWVISLLISLIIVFPGILYIILSASPEPKEIDVYATLFITAGPAVGIYLYSKLISKDRMKIRNNLAEIEADLDEATFQLGNRLSEGYPLEISFKKVAKLMKGSSVAGLFNKISKNITDLGMDVERAIFDKKEGAIKYYPSAIVRSVLRIALMGAKKSMEVAALSLISMSNYLRDVHRINEKVKDILSETLSSMKFQASFLAPVISGLVIGLTAMILIILSVLGNQISKITTSSIGGTGALSGATWILGIFEVSKAIPLWIFQPVVGFYVIEMIVLLCIIDGKIELGGDKLFTFNLIASTMIVGFIIYALSAFIVTIIFTGIAKMAVAAGVAFA